MTKQTAKKKVLDYLKSYNIPYRFLNEGTKIQAMEDLDTVYLCAEVGNTVIDGYIETSIRFHSEENGHGYLVVNSYYCKPIVHTEEEAMRAARFINYLNYNLYYDCDWFCRHYFAVNERDGDIYNTCWLRYELLEDAASFEEAMNHILNYSVQQIAEVCVPLIGYVIGEADWHTATVVGIDHKLMGLPIPGPQD